MRAVVLERKGGPGVLEEREVPKPVPGPEQVLVRVLACGVCNLDIVTRAGLNRATGPQILGHEICGEVVELGAGVSEVRVGDRVANKNHWACGRCRFCKLGDETHCQFRRLNGGGYAEYTILPVESIVKVPDNVPSEHAAIFGCAIAIGLRAINSTAPVTVGSSVLVTGASGGIGCHTLQLAKLAGARTIAVTAKAEKVDRLRNLGADDVIVTGGRGFSEDVNELTGGRGAEFVFDHVGSPVFDQALKSLAIRGKYIFIGELFGDRVSFHIPWMFRKDLEFYGSGPGRRRELESVVNLVSEGRVRPTVAEVLPLAQAAQAHEHLEGQQPVGRIVLVP